jgi:hypothetical protein
MSRLGKGNGIPPESEVECDQSPCSLLVKRLAGAEVLNEWLQSAVVPA